MLSEPLKPDQDAPPSAIVSVLRFSFLVGPNLAQSFLVRLLVIFDRGHCAAMPPIACSPSAMTGLDAEQ